MDVGSSRSICIDSSCFGLLWMWVVDVVLYVWTLPALGCQYGKFMETVGIHSYVEAGFPLQ